MPTLYVVYLRIHFCFEVNGKESEWVVSGQENGYSFPYPRLLGVEWRCASQFCRNLIFRLEKQRKILTKFLVCRPQKTLSEGYCFRLRLWFLCARKIIFSKYIKLSCVCDFFLSAGKEFFQGYCFQLRLWFFFTNSTIRSIEKVLHRSKKPTSRFWRISTFWGPLSPKKVIFGMSSVSLSVCASICGHYNSKNNWGSSTKFGMWSYMIKISAGIAYEQNQPTVVASALIAQFSFLAKSALKMNCTKKISDNTCYKSQ